MIMSFSSVFADLREAAEKRHPGRMSDECVVSKRSLRELLYHFDRLDTEIRAIDADKDFKRGYEKNIRPPEQIAMYIYNGYGGDTLREYIDGKHGECVTCGSTDGKHAEDCSFYNYALPLVRAHNAHCSGCELPEDRPVKIEQELIPCSHYYRDYFCGYDGDLPMCDKTFDDCKLHGNVERFNGYVKVTYK
jgi:hypothetical protein